MLSPDAGFVIFVVFVDIFGDDRSFRDRENANNECPARSNHLRDQIGWLGGRNSRNNVLNEIISSRTAGITSESE